MSGPVLFCFDGSTGSLSALTAGGALIRPQAAVVLTVWETLATQLVASGSAFTYVPEEGDFDAREEAAAWDAARQGAAAAESHGWPVTPRVENAPVAVWRTVVDVADELGASLVVCGSRGRNPAKRALLGSVSEAVLHHCRRPTLIAPEPTARP